MRLVGVVVFVVVFALAVIAGATGMTRLLPPWAIGILLGVAMVAWLIARVLIIGAFDRRIAKTAPPTPAALWARSRGWTYQRSTDFGSVDSSMWIGEGCGSPPYQTKDSIHGRYRDLNAWAFAFSGSTYRGSAPKGQAVVVELDPPWPGLFEASSSEKLVVDLCGKAQLPQSVGRWFVCGEPSAPDTTRLVGTFRLAGLDRVFDSSALPADAELRACNAEGRYLALIVDWASAPDTLLVPALDFLCEVADKLTAQLREAPQEKPRR